MPTEFLQWVPAISLVVAILAATIALRSSQISSRSLRLAIQLREERDRGATIYLIDAFLRRNKQDALASFALTFSNISDVGVSITRLDLVVWRVKPDQQLSALTVSINDHIQGEFGPSKLKTLSVPVNIAARSSISGWATFCCPRTMTDGLIDRFDVVATTSVGQRINVESFLIREVHDEKDSNS